MAPAKYQTQAEEIERLLKSSGFSLEELSARASVNLVTMRRIARGYQQAGKHTMRSIHNAVTLPVYAAGSVKETAKLNNAPLRRLRYIPVVSWAKAGEAVAFEDLPSDWMQRVAADVDDSGAFGVEIAGDSMEPRYYAGEIAILTPSKQARNGDLVVANLKNDGIVLKLFHLIDDGVFQLMSYNPLYPPLRRREKDFHWIYPVDSIIKKMR